MDLVGVLPPVRTKIARLGVYKDALDMLGVIPVEFHSYRIAPTYYTQALRTMQEA